MSDTPRNRSEQLNELATALAKAQGAFGNAQYDRANTQFKSKYATLASVIDATKGPMSANGLSITQGLGYADGKVSVDTLLLHSSGQWIASNMTFPCQKNAAQSEIQAAGSVTTYIRRYTYMAALGISSAEDDTDGADATQPPLPQKPKTQTANVKEAIKTNGQKPKPSWAIQDEPPPLSDNDAPPGAMR